MRSGGTLLRILNLFILAGLLLIPDAVIAGEASRICRDLSRAHDWWSDQALDCGFGLQDPGNLKKEKDLEEAIRRIRNLGPGADKDLVMLTDRGTTDVRCWAIELMGRMNNPALDVKRLSEDSDWKVRAAVMIAVGRFESQSHNSLFVELLSQGLSDTEVVYLRQDPRRIGEGGSAQSYQPVILAALKGLILAGKTEVLPAALSGLRLKPCISRSYDSTPDPFPDIVTEVLPPWVPDGIDPIIVKAGLDAVTPLLDALMYPDTPFHLTHGGRHNINREEPGLISRTFRQTPPTPTGYLSYLLYHLEMIEGREGVITAILDAEKSGKYPKGAFLPALGLRAENPKALAVLLKDADDHVLFGAITNRNHGSLKGGIDQHAIVDRLIGMLSRKEDQFIYSVPRLLGEIDDPRVVKALLGLLEERDGTGALSAEHRGIEAIRGLAKTGGPDVLEKIKSLRQVGDLDVATNEWIRVEVENAITSMEERLKNRRP
ncbi:MAG TPA: HEAT repeat domain-containing protein [Thermoanaerobaculia bacterium]|nr:HEAT repeat domain-containing protein [Thermoanaerobaculia bacterium]